jgi:hypothetical protein
MEGVIVLLLYGALLFVAGGSGVRFPDLDSIIEADPKPGI